MSTRRETVYTHGCEDNDCDIDSHGCARVEIWVDSPTDRDTIGYIYDATMHCPDCAEARFDEQTLKESREIGRLVPGDEWWDVSVPGCQALTCDSCSAVIDESHDDQTCRCTAAEFRGGRPPEVDQDEAPPPAKLTLLPRA